MRFLKGALEALEGGGPLAPAFGVAPSYSGSGPVAGAGAADEAGAAGPGAAGAGAADEAGGAGAAAAGAAAAAASPVQALLESQGVDPPMRLALLLGVMLWDRPAAPMPAGEALEALRRYAGSSGRYGPDAGPFLTPLYGCGEMPQARACEGGGGGWGRGVGGEGVGGGGCAQRGGGEGAPPPRALLAPPTLHTPHTPHPGVLPGGRGGGGCAGAAVWGAYPAAG